MSAVIGLVGDVGLRANSPVSPPDIATADVARLADPTLRTRTVLVAVPPVTGTLPKFRVLVFSPSLFDCSLPFQVDSLIGVGFTIDSYGYNFESRDKWVSDESASADYFATPPPTPPMLTFDFGHIVRVDSIVIFPQENVNFEGHSVKIFDLEFSFYGDDTVSTVAGLIGLKVAITSQMGY